MKKTIILHSILILCLFLLQGSSQLPRRGMDRALFIAIDQYDHMANLNNPIRNVERIAALLEREYDFETEILRNPTIEQIENAIDRYKDNYTQRISGFDPEGQLLIFFSGHGDTESGNGYFLAKNSHPDRLTRTAFSYNDGRNIIDRIPCKHILVAVDACLSARFDERWESRGPEGDDEEPDFGRRGELSQRDHLLEDYRNSRTRYFFTSDSKLERTPDNSDFANKFELGLRTDPGADDILTSDEFWLTLSQARPRARKGQFGTQDGIDLHFLFIRNAATPPRPADVTDPLSWRQASSRHSVAGYQEYLGRFPNGEFATLARQRISELSVQEDKAAWDSAKRLNTQAAYQSYLDRFPQGLYRDLAEAAQRRDSDAFQRAFQLNTAEAFQTYLRYFPDGSYADVARDHLLNFNRSIITPARDIPEGMVFIQGSTFQMGDTFGEGKDDEKPIRSVTVSDFYLGMKEVTMAEYEAFCYATSRSKREDEGWGRGSRPAIHVSWEDAVAYCNWRSEQASLIPVYRISGNTVTANWKANGYRLPTEAEWEYAAREGGRKGRFGNGKDIADPREINFNGAESYKKTYSLSGENRAKTMPVGSFPANVLGLFDMSGNVWEWCWDWYGSGYYASSDIENPKGPTSGANRVVRGGSWYSISLYCRASGRSWAAPGYRYDYLGFRLARNLP